jgi:hypothetical protein
MTYYYKTELDSELPSFETFFIKALQLLTDFSWLSIQRGLPPRLEQKFETGDAYKQIRNFL